MAALFQPDISSDPRPGSSRPRLEFIEGGASSPANRVRSSAQRGVRVINTPRRVFWQRRLAVLLAVAAAALLVGSAVSALSPTVATEKSVPATYVVQPGDTLWGIAQSFDLGGDVRDTIAQLSDANGGSAIMAGQRLVIPRTLRA